MIENIGPLYRVWGIDNIAYGPVELPALVNWIQAGRVTAGTWIFTDKTNMWQPASELTELKALFRQKPTGAAPAKAGGPRVTPGMLRRVKLLAVADEKLLESMLRY